MEFDRQAQMRDFVDKQAEYRKLVDQVAEEQAKESAARAKDETELKTGREQSPQDGTGNTKSGDRIAHRCGKESGKSRRSQSHL